MIQATHLRHAYRQAPWRIQRQWAGVFLLFLLVLAMVSALYLDVTANAAIAGREIQQLRFEITATQRMNADLETRLAVLLSTRSMEARARALGFRPAEAGEIHYLLVPGYVQASGVRLESISAPAAAVSSLPPEYTLSLLDWLAALLSSSPDEVAMGETP
jgi:cell division protein FtsB